MSVKIAILTEFNPKGVKDAQAGLHKLSDINDKVFKAVGGAAALAAAGIAKFAADSIGAASNLAESTNAVNVAFGKSAKAVLAIGENSAESLGLAQNAFNQAAVRFSAFADRIAGEGGDTAGVIQTLTQRAADFASVFNIEVSEALQVFQSGLSGEAEPLKRFGINLLQSEVKAYALANGIIEVGEQMTEAEKVQARYGLLLQSTAKTAGDFANTSDGLANSQRILKAQFEDLQAEVGTALLPAFTELVGAVGDQLMPRLEELGEFLNSPEGKKIIDETANTVLDLVESFIELFPTLQNVGAGLLVLTGSIKILEGAFAAARLAAMLFSTTIAVTSPILGLIALIGTLTVGFVAFHEVQKQIREGSTGLTGRQAELRAELTRLKELLDAGVLTYQQYQDAIGPVVRELSTLEGQAGATTGEFNRFNNLKLDGVKSQIRGVSAEIMAMYHSGVAATAVFEGVLDPRTGKGVDFTLPRRTAGGGAGGDGGGGSGPSAFEQAREKVQGLIRSSQKQLADAQKTFVQAQASARKNYADNILQIEKDFAGRLDGIIRQSQDRLRSAYRGAVEENIAALFDRSEDKSIAGLVKSLSDKLAGSRQLLANSAQLASQGFSQTFIEQVVSAGTTTGNELASAILQSTPETQAELKNLFRAVEVEATTGMDSLSKEIFEKQDLATEELKTLYANTQVELDLAMIAQKTILDNSLSEANETFIESVTEIKNALATQLADMKGQFGGMGRTIDQFIAKLDELIAKSKQISNAPSISFMPEPVVAGGAPVIAFQPVPTTTPSKPTTTPTVVVNNRIVVPNQQSAAMVGKSVAKELNKYTGGGGGLRGVAFVAV